MASQQDFHSFPSILHPKSQTIKKLPLTTFTLPWQGTVRWNNTEGDARETQPKSSSPNHMAGLWGQAGSRCAAWQWKWGCRCTHEPEHGTENSTTIITIPQKYLYQRGVQLHQSSTIRLYHLSAVPSGRQHGKLLRALLFSTLHNMNLLHFSGSSAGNLKNILAANAC